MAVAGSKQLLRSWQIILSSAAFALILLPSFVQYLGRPATDFTGAAIAPTQTPAFASPPGFHATNYQWVPQTWNDQGPASLAQVLHHFGVMTPQNELAANLKPNTEDKNVSPWELVRYVNDHTKLKAIQRFAGTTLLLKQLIASDFGVLVEVGFELKGEGWLAAYYTPIGYEDNQTMFYVLDTFLGAGQDHRGSLHSYADLDEHWQQFNRTYLVIYPSQKEAELKSLLGPDFNPKDNAVHAEQIARSEASARPDDPFTWFNLGSSDVLLGHYPEAAAAFDKAWTVGPLPPRMLWYQFTPYEAYYHAGNDAAVLALSNVILANTPYVEETFYWRAMAEAALGQDAQAISDLERALRLNPNYTPAVEELGKLKSSLWLF